MNFHCPFKFLCVRLLEYFANSGVRLQLLFVIARTNSEITLNKCIVA